MVLHALPSYCSIEWVCMGLVKWETRKLVKLPLGVYTWRLHWHCQTYPTVTCLVGVHAYFGVAYLIVACKLIFLFLCFSFLVRDGDGCMVASMFFCDMEWLDRGCLGRLAGVARSGSKQWRWSVETGQPHPGLQFRAGFVATPFCVLAQDPSLLGAFWPIPSIFILYTSSVMEWIRPLGGGRSGFQASAFRIFSYCHALKTAS